MAPRFLYNDQVMQRLQGGKSYYIKDADYAVNLSEEVLAVDRLIISADNLAVKELRALILQLQETPYGEQRIFIVLNADLLSTVLQNTLLKLVEEPPKSLVIILQANFPNRLLPTVRSRLHTVVESDISQSKFASAEFGLDVSTLASIEKAKLIPTLQQLSNWLLGQENSSTRLSLVADTIRRLELRCNSKLTIDRFLLRWQLLSGIE